MKRIHCIKSFLLVIFFTSMLNCFGQADFNKEYDKISSVVQFKTTTGLLNYDINPIGIQELKNGGFLVLFSHGEPEEATNYECYLAKSNELCTNWNVTYLGKGHSGQLVKTKSGFSAIFCEYDNLTFINISPDGNLEEEPKHLEGNGFYDANLIVEKKNVYVLAFQSDSILFYQSNTNGKTWEKVQIIDISGDRVLPPAFFIEGKVIHILRTISKYGRNNKVMHYWKDIDSLKWSSKEFCIPTNDGANLANIVSFNAQKDSQRTCITLLSEDKSENDDIHNYYIGNWNNQSYSIENLKKISNNVTCNNISIFNNSFQLSDSVDLVAFCDYKKTHIFLKKAKQDFLEISEKSKRLDNFPNINNMKTCLANDGKSIAMVFACKDDLQNTFIYHLYFKRISIKN